MSIKFEKANLKHQKVIFEWLKEPHMKEFWDNSQEHKDDILNFMNGRTEPSNYFNGMHFYWVGSINGYPYSLIMTYQENEETDPPDYMKPYLSKTGKTFGLDFCIGNKNFFGQGLGASTLIAFMEYFSSLIELKADTFLIDPFINNPRAIHVYQKAGFQVVCEFTQEGGYFDQSKGILMVKTL